MSYLLRSDKALAGGAEGTRQYRVVSRTRRICSALREASVNDNFAMTGIVFSLQGSTYKMTFACAGERPRQRVLYQGVSTYPLQLEPTNFRAHNVAVSRSGAAVLPTDCPTENGAWRSSVARLLWEQEVPGSNPGAPTSRERAFGPLSFAGRRALSPSLACGSRLSDQIRPPRSALRASPAAMALRRTIVGRFFVFGSRGSLPMVWATLAVPCTSPHYRHCSVTGGPLRTR